MEEFYFIKQIKSENKTYNCVRIIGEGCFGKVYESYSTDNWQRYAIKSLNLVRNTEEKIQNEISILKNIESSVHVLKIFEHFKYDNFIHIVMEYMPGGNLSEYIDNIRSIPLSTCAKFLKQIVLGLKEIHPKKIIHRDLKPDNILLSEQGPEAFLKIADFGLSKQQDLAQSDVGAPIYKAPEVNSQSKYSCLCDI